jgi:predicted dehydrogenase
VVVPPAHHPEIVGEAVRRGIPVLLEKPAAISVDAGKRMLAQVREAGIPVMMGHTLRFNGVVETLLRERDRLGPLHALRLSQHFEPSPLDWVDDPGLSGKGGILLHTGVHSFDLARLLSGAEPETVFCRATRIGDVALENNFSAVFTMTGGILAEVSGSRATAGRSGSLELVGSEGQLLGDHVQNTVLFARGGDRASLEVPPDVPTVRATLEAFAGVLSRGLAVPIGLEEGVRAVAMAEACARSSELGSAVQVEEVT